ncbi:tetratricopeptide repeat protein [Planctomyces sp. SH-PL14]|uniref:tetratricopeptide repeat protein n=1 Tax=Planctomyces sp. SH-PL14 TaxID=1632864 RepID=UPI00078D737C|nr:tetratricopeptide repeat protein [Planctomyces sp. SH-PL14]AMV20290.1 hypothetical protein VT03_20500 [Planctomyces sp. SH-PL14]
MKRSLWRSGLAGVLAMMMATGPAFGRGFGGGGFGGGGGGFRGGGGGFGGGGFGGGGMGGGGFRGGMPSGGFGGGGFGGGGGGNFGGGGYRGGGGNFGGGNFGGGNFGGGGLSGSGFRPAPQVRPGMPSGIGLPGGGGGGIGGGGFNRPGGEFGGGGGMNRPNVVHPPGGGGIGLGGDGGRFGIGDRPQIQPGGGINRGDLSPGNRPGLGGGGEGLRPGAGGGGTANLPGLGGGGVRPGQGGAGERLPGIGGGGVRPGQGGAGERLPGIGGGGTRPGQGGAGERWNAQNPGSISDRHQDLANRFDNMDQHWGDSGWHHQNWEGPNGGDVNHIGFWGPNGYWGHTGVSGPNGGHWGHSTGIGPNGAYGRTTGIGPNGAVWGHGGAIGPNGAFGYAGYAGPAGHWSRNWGGWYNGYAPAWGNGRWNYLWDQYPVAMGFGCTMWGLNSVAWAFGVGTYWNPYCDGPVYVNNQPVVTYTEPVVGDPSYDQQAADNAAADAAAGPGQQGEDPLTEAFNLARVSFYNGDYQDALKRTNDALVKAPRDAAINEFRSLCLFALGQYRDSAATIHSVLAAGPGWDWTTMISLYQNQDTYTAQLRALEDAAKASPDAADLRFLLAYHYITCDHKDAAVVMLKEVVRLQPKDELAAELVKMYSPAPDQPAATAEAKAPDLEKPAFPMEKLEGDWTAKDDSGGAFKLHLGDKDVFTWTFTRDGQPQAVSGAYIVRGTNLVMQPDSGGTMISTIALKNDSTLSFTPVGNAKALTFTK